MNDLPLIRQLPNGCQVRIVWNGTDRRYRAELTLPDGTLDEPHIERNSAGQPDGVARLIKWAWAEAEKVTPIVEARIHL